MTYFGGFAATTNGAPRGAHPMRGIMATKCRAHFQNPKLRELEREIAERAYRVRAFVRVGSSAYQRLSDAIRGQCSLRTLALIVDLEAKHGASLSHD